MHPLNNFFDRVYCINLAERSDKKKKMQKKFDKLGIEVEWYTAVKYNFIPKIVPTIIKEKVGYFNSNQIYEFGAALSHYSVIKKALIEGYAQIFVFEDDVLFDKKFNDKIQKYLDTIPNQAHMIMLYSFIYNLLPENKKINSRWMKSFKAWSLMAYGMEYKMMEEYIKSQDKFFTISDLVTFRMQENPIFNIYSAIPSICIPDTVMGSNIRGDNMNYLSKPSITNLGISNDNYE